MQLFYIKAGDELNNRDLFAWAADAEGAKRRWREYYEADTFDEPERIWEIPSANGPSQPAALAWGTGIIERT